METTSQLTVNIETLIALIREDDPNLNDTDTYAVALRIFNRPGKPGACVHRMPQGMSAFKDGACVRCGSAAHVKDSDCTVDPGNDYCSVCGVLHGEPCSDCGGKGFHQYECVAISPSQGVTPRPEKAVSSFTKGPWNIHHLYPIDGPSFRVKNEHGVEYFTAWLTFIAAGKKIIAEVGMKKMDDPTSGCSPAVEDIEEARANARLMMASPELLAALQAVEWSDLGRCPQCAGRGIHQPACIVGSALAKAAGKCA
jgi:hypothetical protein